MDEVDVRERHKETHFRTHSVNDASLCTSRNTLDYFEALFRRICFHYVSNPTKASDLQGLLKCILVSGGGAPLLTGKSRLGSWQLSLLPPLDCAKKQEAKLTLPCKSEISLFGLANSILALLSSTGETSPVLLTVKNK